MRAPAVLILALVLTGCASAPAAVHAATTRALACQAPCGAILDHGVRWEPSVAVDPRDPLHLVASSEDQTQTREGRALTSWRVASVSRDGGQTWASHALPGGPGASPTDPLVGFTTMDDAVVTILPDGTVLVGALVARDARGAVQTPTTLVVLRSRDGGVTFPETVTVAEGSGIEGIPAAYAFHDKEWFAQGPDGTVLLAWNVNMASTTDCVGGCTWVVFSTSHDGGVSWSPPGVVEKDAVASGAFPLILPDGSWLVSWRDTDRHEARVSITRDQGASWAHTTLGKSTKFPVMALSGSRLWIAYPQSDAATIDGAQIPVARFSDDGGKTWSEPTPLDAPQAEGRTIPAIAAAPEGGAYVTFWHVRPEGGAQLRALVIREGSVSEAQQLDITVAATKFVGDYMGLAALPGGGAYAVWDARHGDGALLVGASIAMR